MSLIFETNKAQRWSKIAKAPRNRSRDTAVKDEERSRKLPCMGNRNETTPFSKIQEPEK